MTLLALIAAYLRLPPGDMEAWRRGGGRCARCIRTRGRC